MALHVMVAMREVWDTRDLTGSIVEPDGAVRTGALTTRLEPEDLNALEMALRLKDEQGARVTALSLGAPRQVDVLREALYRGVDAVQCVEVDPTALDTQATAALLAAAVRKAGGCDLLLVGVTIAEGENALLGVQLAEALGLEQASYVDALLQCADGKAVVRRGVEMGYEDVQLPLPAVLSVGVALVADDPRTPRSAKAMLKLKHKKTAVPACSPAELGVDPAAARTTVCATRVAVPERTIESREIDPKDETALADMLAVAMKGA